MMGQQKPSGVYYGGVLSRVLLHSWTWALMGQQKSSGVYYGGVLSRVLLLSWTWGHDGAAETIRCVLWWSPVPGPAPLLDMGQ